MDSEHKKFLENILNEINNQGKSIASTIDKLDLSVNVVVEQEKKGMLGNLASTLESLSGSGDSKNPSKQILESMYQQQQQQFGFVQKSATEQSLTNQTLENANLQQQQQFYPYGR